MRAANPNAIYHLHVYDDASFDDTHGKAFSNKNEPVNFVVISPEAPDQPYYPRTIAYGSQTGDYQIEYVQRLSHLGTIDPGDTFGSYTIEPENVLSLYTFTGTSNQSRILTLTPSSGDAWLGMAIFQPGSSPEIQLQGSHQAIASALASAPGQPLTINFSMTSAGTYALLIWSQSATSTTTFTLQAYSPLYLPLLRR